MHRDEKTDSTTGLDFDKVVTVTVTGTHEQVVEALELMATVCYALATMKLERTSFRDDEWRGTCMFQPGLPPNENEYSYYAHRDAV